MVAWTLGFGPRPFFDAINVAIVTGVLWILVVRSLNNKSAERDFAVVRGGVLCFVAFAFWDNVVAKFGLPFRVEPYGFAVLLACLGYVVARRTLDRDVELGEIQRELELARRMQLSPSVDHLISTVQRWSNAQADDLTVLICDFIGTPGLAAVD